MRNKLRSLYMNMDLRGKLFVMIMVAGAVSFALFMLMQNVTFAVIDNYYVDEAKWRDLTDEKADELQQYVTDNMIASSDRDAIKAWNKQNVGVYIYIYDEEATIYETSEDIAALSYENYRVINFADRQADMSIFYAIDYKYYMAATVGEIIISILMFLGIFMTMLRGIIRRIDRLEKDVRILEGGGLDHEITVTGNDELGSLGESLNEMRLSLRSNMEREEDLTRANTELVARMAHDLRTPLTSLQLYLDLIDKKKYEDSEQLSSYVAIARDKAAGIKVMTDELFERFLINSDRNTDIEAPKSVRYILEDILSSFITTLEAQGAVVYSDITWPDENVAVSTTYVNRILDNVYSNIMKYADRSRPVTIDVRTEEAADGGADNTTGRMVALMISNYVGRRISREGGSNIGLENIDIMLGKMGGSLEVTDDDVTFEMEMRLPAADPQKED